MTNWICFGVLVLPWVIIPLGAIADPFRLPKAMFFDIWCLGLIAIVFNKGLKNLYRNKYLSWLSAWIFITFIFNYFFPMAWTINNRSLINLWTIEPMIHIILALVVSFLAMSYLDKDDFLKIARVLCYSAVLVSAFGILQILGLDPFGKVAHYNHQNKFSAFLDNPNIVGNYLCLIYPLFFIFNEKKMKLLSLLVAGGVLLSLSTISIIVATLGFLILALFLQRKFKFIKWGLPIVIILGSFLLINNISFLKVNSGFSGRIDLWGRALVHLKDNPLFGQGAGIFKTWEIAPIGVKWLNCHNDWLERTIEFGVIGLFLMLLVVINSFRNFNYKLENRLGICYLVSFISFLLLMLGSFPMEIAPVAFMGLISFWATEKM